MGTELVVISQGGRKKTFSDPRRQLREDTRSVRRLVAQGKMLGTRERRMLGKAWGYISKHDALVPFPEHPRKKGIW